MFRIYGLPLWLAVCVFYLPAQTPTGILDGRVNDPSGAAVAAGAYRVTVDKGGFQK